ncbi:hypothetical protein BpHYR1_002476 [Brachionus plicatilis]|uniref:Uncharacterized protein n=1 Tax=Brachionus plicatilis TaxID=10195 RepID=A0A3M7SAZ1_BRAPC|nr:hypothetical protein BpHYR1_002476 [Brachionus plicatilis]
MGFSVLSKKVPQNLSFGNVSELEIKRPLSVQDVLVTSVKFTIGIGKDAAKSMPIANTLTQRIIRIPQKKTVFICETI